MKFLNLQGSQRADVSLASKVFRLATYYAKVIRYAATAKPKSFTFYGITSFSVRSNAAYAFYRLLGKKIVLTVHNCERGQRDSKDTFLNRLTLKINIG